MYLRSPPLSFAFHYVIFSFSLYLKIIVLLPSNVVFFSLKTNLIRKAAFHPVIPYKVFFFSFFFFLFEFIVFLCCVYEDSAKKFCHWVRITSVLRFIEHISITNLRSIPPLLKHIFVTFLPSREKQINSLLLVSVGDTDK